MGNSPSQQQQHQHQHQHQNQNQNQNQPLNHQHHHPLHLQNQFRASPLSPSAGIPPHPTAASPAATHSESSSQDYFSHRPLPHTQPHAQPHRLPPPTQSQPIAIHHPASTRAVSAAAMAASPGHHQRPNPNPNPTSSSLDQPFVGSPLSYASSLATQHPGMTAEDSALAQLPENTQQLPVVATTTSPPLSPTSAGNAPSALTAALRASAVPPSPSSEEPDSQPTATATTTTKTTTTTATTTLPPPSPARTTVAAVPASMLVPTTISYTHPPPSSSSSSTASSIDPPPSSVFITGTFNAWRSKIPLRLQPTTPTTFSVTLALAPGIYRFKFIVDDEWRCAHKLPTAQDEDGNLVNFIEVAAAVASENDLPPLSAAPTTTTPAGAVQSRAATAPSPTPQASNDPASVAAAASSSGVSSPVPHSPARAVPPGGAHHGAPAASAVPNHVRSTGNNPSPLSSSVPIPTSRGPSPSHAQPVTIPHSYHALPATIPGLPAHARSSAAGLHLAESPPGTYASRLPTAQSLLGLAALALQPSPGGSAPGAAAAPPPTGTFTVTQGPDGTPVLDPPNLPAHLTKVVLNQVKAEDQSLPVPPHVSLNHLYACSIKDGVMAVAVTARYRKKCVTTVVYRPVNI